VVLGSYRKSTWGRSQDHNKRSFARYHSSIPNLLFSLTYFFFSLWSCELPCPSFPFFSFFFLSLLNHIHFHSYSLKHWKERKKRNKTLHVLLCLFICLHYFMILHGEWDHISVCIFCVIYIFLFTWDEITSHNFTLTHTWHIYIKNYIHTQLYLLQYVIYFGVHTHRI
jgi:hypothetical protein